MGIQEEYWELIEGKAIVSIDTQPSYPDIPNSASFDWIRFYVKDWCLSLTINEDTDEIVLNIDPAVQSPQPDPQMVVVLRALVGREFFWLWRAENSQGYEDTVMMSFASLNPDDGTLGAVVPQIAFVGVASSIQLFQLVAADEKAM